MHHEFEKICKRCGASADAEGLCPAKVPKDHPIAENVRAAKERAWGTCSELHDKAAENSNLRNLAVQYIAQTTWTRCLDAALKIAEKKLEAAEKLEIELLPDGWYWETYSDYVVCRHFEGASLDPYGGGIADRCEGNVPQEVRAAWGARTRRLGFKRYP